jgi:hypothetical protein
VNCDWVRERAGLYAYGELESAEEELFEEHLGQCENCRALVEENQHLLGLLNDVEVAPSAGLLERCRVDFAAAHQHRQTGFAARWRCWTAWVPTAAPWIWKPALGCALMLIGFGAGTWNEQRQSLLRIEAEFARVRAIEGTGEGTVQILFEEPRQRRIEGGLHEAGIERALLAAVRRAEDPGLRGESVDLLRNRCNNEDVRRVVLQTLEKDDNPLVRLRALEALRPYASQPEVQQSLGRLLLRDPDPRLRIQSINLLVDGTNEEMVGTLQQAIRNEQDEYIRAQCLRLLARLRASPGVF